MRKRAGNRLTEARIGTSRRLALGLAAILAVAAFVQVGASGATVASTASSRTYGSAELVLSKPIQDALRRALIKVTPVSPATATDGGYSFPITTPLSRALVLRQVSSSGGLNLKNILVNITIANVRAKLALLRTSYATAEVNGTRQVIGTLGFNDAKFSFSPNAGPGRGTLIVTGVSVFLTQEVASTLNSLLPGSSFTTTTLLGTATVNYDLRSLF
jgi:hypothetical protein